MVFIDQMKNFKIYRTKTFLPTVKGDKKKGSTVLLLTPNYESSKRLMNNPMFVNSRRFASYYIERSISYYINSNTVEEVDENALLESNTKLVSLMEQSRSELSDEDFGVPELRKFPLDSEKHVRSAIKFFNYVDPKYEKELAENIKSAIDKYDIKDIKCTEANRFSKYYPEYLKESSDGIPSYVKNSNQLELYYYLWDNGMMSEDEARKNIFNLRGRNLANKDKETPADVPTPEEYYKLLGRLTKYLGESVEELTEATKRKMPVCPKCGTNENVGIFIQGEPIFKCKTCGKYIGTVPFKEFSQELLPAVDSSKLVSALSEDTNVLNTGDKLMIFGESTLNDTQLKRLLYTSRIRYRKDLVALLEKTKKDNPWIQYTYTDIKKYMKRNIFFDLYYYNTVFFENNKWIAKKGLSLYTDFMTRLINHPVIKNGGYSKKTIFIPVADWDFTKDGMVWNYRKAINPISCIYQMMFTGMSGQLKKAFGNTDIIFTASDKYFKINFSEIDDKDIKKLATKFKIFWIKICKGEEFEAEDVDSSTDNAESPEVLQAKIVDKIENSKGIDITKKVSDANDKQKEIINKSKKIEKEFKASDKIANKSMTIGWYSITSQKPEDIKIIKKAQADQQKLDDETKSMAANNKADSSLSDEEREQQLSKLADAIARSTNDNSDEDDALDQLDNEDIKRILVSLGNDDYVNISASRSSRMNELDNNMLDKEVKGKSIKDILSDESNKEEVITSVNVSSPNKDEWDKLKFVNFDKNYNIDKDIIGIFRSFANCSRPIVVRDIKVTDNSTSEDRVALYEVDMEDYRGKRFKIKLDIPIMEDNRFLLRGNYKSIQTQFFNMPIIKTDLDTCQLISNYKKIFLYRFGDSKGKSLPATSKFIKAANKYKGRKLKFTTGDNSKVCTKYHLPIDYIDLASEFSKIESDKWIVYFNQDEIRSLYTIEDNKGFPFAFNKELNAVEYFRSDIPEAFINILCDNVFRVCPDFKDLYTSMTRPTICAYTRASIMSSKIPLALICGYHIGMRATMERANITYEIVESLSKEIKSDVNKDWIEFNDGYIVYNVTYESSLLMNGLKACSTDMYNIEEMDNKNMYLEFLDNYGGRIKADGLDNFYDLFVDPMIKESLEYYHLPTNYIDILLYGNSLLSDNKYIKHTDTSSRRLRRYQLISVYTYKVLSTAYGNYANQLKHSRQAAEFSVKQSAVIDEFLLDTISSDDSCINALRDVETTNSITTKGPSGMNAERAYSLDKRGYDESMINVVGMSTGFAGNVGITRQATIDSNVTPEGYVKQYDGSTEEMNDANTLTATEAMIPFGSTRDDPMRTAMSFIQTSKHMVRTEDSDPLLVTSGADEVMPYLTTNKFAFKAAQDGIVKEVTDEYIIVEYADGTKDYINLKETTEHNSDGGYYVPLKLDIAENIKVNTKFKKDQILAYDKYSFSNKLGESNNIAYNIGKLAKIAIVNSDEGFEDSGIISESMAKKLATRVDLKYDSIINKDATVFKIAKIGDHIEASDDLLIWQDAFDDEDAADVIAGLSDGNDISDIGKRKLKSEVTGILRDIKILRTVEIDELSYSIKKIVNDYEKPIKEKAKKLKENGISIAKLPAHYVLPPNGKLKKAQGAIIIEFYVEYLDTVGVGDKIVYNSANKAVEKGIFPKGKEPYTEFRPNENIDAFVSVTSISKRLVSSTLIYGSLQKLMIELDRSVKDIMEIPYDDSTV